ncbi:hypothetical protein [Faecalimicrobium sp. JNUCC 81]
MLSLLKDHDSLNYDQFYVLVRGLCLEGFSGRISYLLNENLIEKSDPFLSQEEREDCTVSLRTKYRITLKGIQYLENKKSEDRKFKIQSVYVPVLVAFLTSIVTSFLTLWITK